MSAATRVSSSSSVAQPARVKRARSDAGASREQALAIPPPDGENGGGGVGGGTGNVYLDSPSQGGGSGGGGMLAASFSRVVAARPGASSRKRSLSEPSLAEETLHLSQER